MIKEGLFALNALLHCWTLPCTLCPYIRIHSTDIQSIVLTPKVFGTTSHVTYYLLLYPDGSAQTSTNFSWLVCLSFIVNDMRLVSEPQVIGLGNRELLVLPSCT